MYGCSRVVLVAGAVKRNTSRPIVQDELPKVLMVPSTGSEKGVSLPGSAVENGPGLYTPSGPQGSGTWLSCTIARSFCFASSCTPSHLVFHPFYGSCVLYAYHCKLNHLSHLHLNAFKKQMRIAARLK